MSDEVVPQPVIVDRHARRRMRERGLSPEEVFLAIREPDKTEPTLKGRRNAFKQLEPDKAIRVIFLEQGDSILVITGVRRSGSQEVSSEDRIYP